MRFLYDLYAENCPGDTCGGSAVRFLYGVNTILEVNEYDENP
jgi:hypothetical protein